MACARWTYFMAEMLLDITVLQDYAKGDDDARSIIEQVIEGTKTAAISSLALFELWRNPSLDRKTEIGYVALLSFLEDAPLSAEAAKTAGLWLASVDEAERDKLVYFALVAATARERGEPICTRNPEAFSRFYSDFVEY